MSDAREALVALILERFRAAETYMDLPRQAGLLADEILAAGWTPPGERVKPSVEAGVYYHQNANYLAMMSERDALRAEVERLREVSAAQPYETERELAVALDEARQQVADLRAFASWLVSLDDDNPDSPGRQERRTVTLSQIIDRARVTLAGSGEQPGEVTRVEARGRGYGKTQAMAERVADAVKARGLPAEVLPAPAPMVPDSADVREDEDGLLPIEQSLASALWARWADRGGTPCVTIQEDPRTVARALRPWLLAAVRPSGQEGS